MEKIKKMKLIGLDLDGTLLNDQKELTAYTREILRRAIDQGIIVLPATGRPLSGVPRELRDFPGMRYFLTSNGARIIDQEEGKVIFEGLLPVAEAMNAMTILAEYDTLREVFCEGIGYIDEGTARNAVKYVNDERTAEYIRNTRCPVPDVREFMRKRNLPVDKIRASFTDLRERCEALERVGQLPGLSITGAFAYDIEINCMGVHKGRGLLELGRHLGIAIAEIMCCGDGHNDIEMIRESGFGVAMANGADEAKAYADYITGTNNEDGAAKAIEKFALQSGGKSC